MTVRVIDDVRGSWYCSAMLDQQMLNQYREPAQKAAPLQLTRALEIGPTLPFVSIHRHNSSIAALIASRAGRKVSGLPVAVLPIALL